MILLHRYWFEFDFSAQAASYGWRYLPALGCGITAYNYADAIRIMQIFLLRDPGMPLFKAVIVDIDVSTLDPRHILPNIGVPVWRGLWYPKITLWYGPGAHYAGR